MATTFSQSTDASKGTYRVTRVGLAEQVVHVGCPSCGSVIPLQGSYISPDGEVRPPVLCACGFHDSVQLEGWPSVRAGVPSVQRRSSSPQG